MQVTKFYIEGQQAARSGFVRACRYVKPENVEEFNKGYDSVDRSHSILSRSPRGVVEVHGVGSLAECQDRAVTLGTADRSRRYYVANTATGEEYIYKAFNE